MELDKHPIVIIITCLASLVAVAAAAWGALVYLRTRFVSPLVLWIRKITAAADDITPIKDQLFSPDGRTLRELVEKMHERVALAEGRDLAFWHEHPNGIFVTDALGLTTWVNRTYCRMFECSESEVHGQGWKKFIDPELRDTYSDDWFSAVNDRREFIGTMICEIRGVEHVFKVRAYPVDGVIPRGYTGFVEHVSGQ